MVNDGCIINHATIRHSLVAIRSIVGNGSELNRVVLMGGDYYESHASIVENELIGKPRIGIGQNTRSENAIIDKNARMGDNVVLSPVGKPENVDHPLSHIIRDGVVIIPKNGAPDFVAIGAFDLEPLPQVLREAKSVKVRPETEVVGDTACVVVEATSKHGMYTLWLDESDDATLRKAEVVKNNGDQYTDLPTLGKMTVDGAPVRRTHFTMDNVAVEKINGKSVPVSARMETTYTLNDGRTQTIRREDTRSGTDLDPDFVAIGAFDLEPGAGR